MVERKFVVYQLDMWGGEDREWIQNDQYELGEIIVKCKTISFRAFNKAIGQQMGIYINPRYAFIDTSFAFEGGYEIVARKQRKPLFYLQEVR